MILLLGGTSETVLAAALILDAGQEVIVSTVTKVPLRLPKDAKIARIRGKLSSDDMFMLINEKNVSAVADVTHPYAAEVSLNAQKACEKAGIPYCCYVRPSALTDADFIHRAPDHVSAAKLACSFSKPVLLTIGTRNLAPYISHALLSDCKIIARVLSAREALKTCDKLGMDSHCVLTGRGPFSVEENLKIINEHKIGVIVSKDSGAAGGLPEKQEAAQLGKCQLVVVERPQCYPPDAYRSLDNMLQKCLGLVNMSPRRR